MDTLQALYWASLAVRMALWLWKHRPPQRAPF